MAVSRKSGILEIDESGGQVTLQSGKTLSADQITEGTNKFVTATQKTNLDNLKEKGRKNLWTDGALKYFLERITVTDPATNVYGSTLIQIKHLKASGTRGTMTVAQQALTAGVSLADYALRVSASGADSSLDADSYYLLRHYIYHGTRNHSNGEKITIPIKVASSVANQKIGIVVRQNYGTTGSPTAEEIITGEIFTLASGENEISKTFTTNTLTGKTFGTDNNDCLIVDLVMQCGSTVATSLFGGSAFGFTEATTLDFYELAAYPGEVAYDFVASDDLLSILPFYEKGMNKETLPSGAPAEISATIWRTESTYSYHGFITFYQTEKIKAVSPTLYSTTGATGKIRNLTDRADVNGSVNFYGTKTFNGYVNNVSIGAGKLLAYHWVADARY